MEDKEKKTGAKEEKASPNGENRPNLRQIILETDGNSVRIVKNETSGRLEFLAIMDTMANLARSN